MKKLILLVTASMIQLALQAQADSIATRIVLIGDAGALVNGKQPVVDAVKKHIPLDKKTTVLYLGDNLYKDGLPDEQMLTYQQAKVQLDSQLLIAKNTGASVYMIPGNHDWNNGSPNGWNAVVREQQYASSLGDPNIHYYPQDGCPGPVTVELTKDVIMVLFDSQWWIHPSVKPDIESDCANKTREDVLNDLAEIVEKNGEKLILFAAHHPFRSNGIHGGFFTLKQHIFPFTDLRKYLYIPLPLIGSAYPLARSVFGTPQDLKHPEYDGMVNSIEGVLKKHPNVIFLHGHEHNLQELKDTSHYYIVSGAGCKTTRVSNSKTSTFTSSKLGFAVLEVTHNKNVYSQFYEVEPDSVSMAHKGALLNYTVEKKVETDSGTAKVIYYDGPDSVLVLASELYKDPKPMRRWMLGTNYRQEWETPVKMKVFNIRQDPRKFDIESMGGGKQTKSLNLVAANGTEYKLRTIDKDPGKAIPENLRGTFGEDIVQDMISASHPYAPLTIPPLAKAIGVVVAEPELYYIPKQSWLGQYSGVMSDKVAFLERTNPLDKIDDDKSTAKVITKIIEEPENSINQETTLKARLLDMLVADWDRHFDQWKWVKTGDDVYHPIPRDRDIAMFKSDGVLPWYLSRKRMPFLKGFIEKMPKVEYLGSSAKDFDRIFLNQLDRTQWDSLSKYVQQRVSNALIDTAVGKLPDETEAIGGAQMKKTLQSRRDILHEKALQYYDFLASTVNVLGTNRKETIHIEEADGKVKVNVYHTREDGDTIYTTYSRVFDPKETSDIRIYGFNGDDIFLVDPEVKSKISFRLIGGRGVDSFDVKGKSRVFIYDFRPEGNRVLDDGNVKLRLSDDPAVNSFNAVEFKYPVTRFPRIQLGYNIEDGFMVGTGLWLQRHGFRKEPYKYDQKFRFLYAPANGAYQMNYRGSFIDVFKYADLVIEGDYVHPTLNNFFGLGNNTVFDKDLGRRYYRTRYNMVSGNVYYRRKFFGNLMQVMVGPTFNHYWINQADNEGKILEHPANAGLDSLRLHSNKAYAGGTLRLIVNNVNSELFPTRGIDWVSEFTTQLGMSAQSLNYSALRSDMTLYTSVRRNPRVVGVLRMGAGKILSDNYEFFQAMSLGAHNYLRGYRKNRFAGDGYFQGGMEMRVRVANVKSYLLPGTLGLIGFSEIGRVWYNGEQSKRWHLSYGGGLYFLPFDMIMVSALVGLSKEDLMFNMSIGTKLNFTF